MKLSGKKALVTGGGTGIGLGIAVALADEGCRVAITGRRGDVLAQASARHGGPVPLLHFPCDVASRLSLHALFEWLGAELGEVDILVNSAGINVARRSMAELDPDDWDHLMAVNATGAYLTMRKVLPAMRRRKDGLIVNISSISGKRAGLLGGVAYSASKFAMAALGTTVALEEAENGIRVTTIYPGEVDTPILEKRPVPVSEEHRARILKPEDVGQAVVMIACLPARAHVPELVIKPTSQPYA
jgi:NAD(P)-dependent dehydrogenase (short-subunit alcohol dehydrogenase family)